MNKLITLSTPSIILSGILLATGCSSGDDGGSSAPAVPTDAATIDMNNASTLVQRASVAGFAITDATESNATSTDCIPTGSSSSTVVESGDLFVTFSETASGVVTLTDCGTSVSGVADTYFIDGALNYSENESINTSNGVLSFSENVNGNAITLTISDMTAPTDKVTVNSYAISTSGSADLATNTGSYTVTGQFSYESLTLKEGFSAQISTPLSGAADFFGPDCPTGGVILVSGASGSQARGTFSDTGVLIEYNTGDGVWTADTTYTCDEFVS